MSSEVFTALTKNIHTVADLRLLQHELNELEHQLYSVGKKSNTDAISEHVRDSTLQILKPVLQSTEKTSKKPQELLQSIQEELKSLPILKLGIAFEPTPKNIENISNWLKKNQEKQWILDLTVRPELMAGVVLEVDGRYKDYSFQTQLTTAITKAVSTLIK